MVSRGNVWARRNRVKIRRWHMWLVMNMTGVAILGNVEIRLLLDM